MTVDNLVALQARDDLLYVASQWPALQARLNTNRSPALTGMNVAGTKERPLVIDVHVSDLMRAIEDATRFYARIMSGEVGPRHGCDGLCQKSKRKRTPSECPMRVDPITDWTMPGMLVQVAGRYGHFTSSDDAMALHFCDDAHDYRTQVARTLERPAPPTYIGPCQTNNCEGELYLRGDKDYVRCPNCSTTVTLEAQRMWLDEQMADRLMTSPEIYQALRVLGYEISDRTIRRWVASGKLVEIEEDAGIYRLKDAIDILTAKASSTGSRRVA